MNFYSSIFKNSMSVTFELEGQHFMALKEGPAHKFTPAISLFVDCELQEEGGRALGNRAKAATLGAAGGSPTNSAFRGIIPKGFGEMLYDPDPARSQRV